MNSDVKIGGKAQARWNVVGILQLIESMAQPKTAFIYLYVYILDSLRFGLNNSLIWYSNIIWEIQRNQWKRPEVFCSILHRNCLNPRLCRCNIIIWLFLGPTNEDVSHWAAVVQVGESHMHLSGNIRILYGTSRNSPVLQLGRTPSPAQGPPANSQHTAI